jgi:hypothetical protein
MPYHILLIEVRYTSMKSKVIIKYLDYKHILLKLDKYKTHVIASSVKLIEARIEILSMA